MTDVQNVRFTTVGKSLQKVDGLPLVTGKPMFVNDIDLPGTLHVKILRSPHAHARILSIDTSRAEALPGVVLVLTHENTSTTRYTTAGQGYPEPSPYDSLIFDPKVRFIGDRVAAVAAETEDIALEALKLIEVQYKELPAVLSLDEALRPDAPVIHDEEDSPGIYDAAHNIVADVDIDAGDVTRGFAESEIVVETT
jgi:CO/xanthine dehydrogenase Mo-binding subunit